MNPRFLLFLLSIVALLPGCSDVEDHDHDHHDHEVMTTVILTFTAQGSGEVVEARWADPEDDGSPVIDDIALLDSEDYDLTLSILNELEDPAEDLTPEILEEAAEHQVFFVGSAVAGPSGGGSSAARGARRAASSSGRGRRGATPPPRRRLQVPLFIARSTTTATAR